jgi:bifunctional non-homologous end joining protein LigD
VNKTELQLEVEGRPLKLTNLDKVMYPETGFTKGEVVDYYTRIAPVLLPHVRWRPLSLKRYPEGVEGPKFWEKRCPPFAPEWMPTATIWSDRHAKDVPYCVVDDLAALMWVANSASLELHTSLGRAPDLATPTMVVFDLDPGPPATVVECAQVALCIRDVLRGVDLESFLKSSGNKGAQLYVPLNTPTTYEHTKGFARTLARVLERERPDLVVSSMKKDLRHGKVLIDWSQNDPRKSTVCAYSLRGKARPTVSLPLTWAEVEAIAAGDPTPATAEAPAALARVEEVGDLFAPVTDIEQTLPAL